MSFYPRLPIVTKRLTLRPFSRGDVDAVHDYRRRDDVATFLLDGPMSREQCAVALQQRIGQVALEHENDRIVLAVDLTRSGALIGEVSLIWRNVEARQAEVGWILHPDHHGCGYATEAGEALLELGFETLGLHRIMARCDARNVASWRVMERLGMRREAHFREHMLVKGRWDDEMIYAVLQREWADSRELPMLAEVETES